MAISAQQRIKQILRALQAKGHIYFYNTHQIWSDNQKKVITLHSISKLERDKETGRKKSIQVYEAPNINRIVLLVRDIWCLTNEGELPYIDNEEWVEIRKTIPILNRDSSV